MLPTPHDPVWDDIADVFKPQEFNHPYQMDADFLRRLAKARRRAGVPFRPVSDHRTAEENEAAGGAENSAHTDVPCKAVDLRVVNNLERWKAVEACIAVGFTRIGVYPPTAWQRKTYGKGAGSVHVDGAVDRPAPRMWLSW